MSIYTGYFSKINYYKNLGMIPVSISLSIPKNVNCPNKISLLAPSWDLLSKYKNGQVSEEGYTQIYLEHLKKNSDNIYNSLNSFINKYPNKNIILLCWESSEKFCHRHIAAKYLNDTFNLNIKEY